MYICPMNFNAQRRKSDEPFQGVDDHRVFSKVGAEAGSGNRIRGNFITTPAAWLSPTLHLLVASIISALTAWLAFSQTGLSVKTVTTFLAFYLVLGSLTLMFIVRDKLTNPGTKQLLHFSFILLGFVLMIIGFLGLFNKSLASTSVLLCMLFLPGLAIFRAGLHFNKGSQ